MSSDFLNYFFVKPGRRWVLLPLVFVCLYAITAQPALGADKKAVVEQARKSYYSLKSEGMTGFQCSLTPNWAALLADQRAANPSGIDAAVQKLSGLHFSVSVGPDGSAKVTHNEISAENQEVAKGLSQIYSGMEQMTTGFFQTWSVFVVNPPLPEVEDDYQLEDLGAQYRLAYKEGSSTNVVTTMGKDFALASTRVTTKDFDSTIMPEFTKTGKGLLMSGYQATYVGTSPADKTELQVKIEYQQVNGLQLPQKLDLKGSYGGSPFAVEVAFSGCEATKQ